MRWLFPPFPITAFTFSAKTRNSPGLIWLMNFIAFKTVSIDLLQPDSSFQQNVFGTKKQKHHLSVAPGPQSSGVNKHADMSLTAISQRKLTLLFLEFYWIWIPKLLTASLFSATLCVCSPVCHQCRGGWQMERCSAGSVDGSNWAIRNQAALIWTKSIFCFWPVGTLSMVGRHNPSFSSAIKSLINLSKLYHFFELI